MLKPSSSPAKNIYAFEAENVGIKYRRYIKQAVSLKELVTQRFKGTEFDTFWALRELNLKVKQGEIIGIIGPNGAGKSTFLRVVAGILRPSEGNISTRGRVAPLLSLGAGFNTELTGRENIILNGVMLGLKRREIKDRIDHIIEFAELADFIDSPLRTYSSGMRARLGFAVATDVDPDIMLLDEIFAVGDEKFRRKAEAHIERYFKGTKTVFIVSHSLSLIEKYSTRVVFLAGGKIQADGGAKEVITEYRKTVQ